MKLNKILAAGALVAMAAFTSCNDDNTTYAPGFEGVDGQIILAPTVNASYKVIKVPGADIQPANVTWNVAPRARVNAAEEIKVLFEIDNSLIDAYNAENGTECVALPEGVVELTTPEAVISAGHSTSDTIVGMHMTDDQAVLATVETGVKYIVPVRMTAVTKGEARLAKSTSNVSYVTFTAEEVLINQSGTPAGSLIPKSGRTAWNIGVYGNGGLYNQNYRGPLDGSSYFYFYLNSGDVTLDMGQNYKFDGIYATSSFGSYYYMIVPGVEISYSLDGEEWTGIGTWSGGKTNKVALYAPVTARHLKFHYESYFITALTDMSVYEVQ